MLEFMKVDAPMKWPSQCFCGSQKGPLVDTGLEQPGYGGSSTPGRIYVCRMCGTRVARTLGLIKGDEHTRLQNAADELAVQEKEVSDRQEIIDRMTREGGQREQKIAALESYIETLQGDLALRDSKLAQVKGLVAA